MFTRKSYIVLNLGKSLRQSTWEKNQKYQLSYTTILERHLQPWSQNGSGGNGFTRWGTYFQSRLTGPFEGAAFRMSIWTYLDNKSFPSQGLEQWVSEYFLPPPSQLTEWQLQRKARSASSHYHGDGACHRTFRMNTRWHSGSNCCFRSTCVFTWARVAVKRIKTENMFSFKKWTPGSQIVILFLKNITYERKRLAHANRFNSENLGMNMSNLTHWLYEVAPFLMTVWSPPISTTPESPDISTTNNRKCSTSIQK